MRWARWAGGNELLIKSELRLDELTTDGARINGTIKNPTHIMIMARPENWGEVRVSRQEGSMAELTRTAT